MIKKKPNSRLARSTHQRHARPKFNSARILHLRTYCIRRTVQNQSPTHSTDSKDKSNSRLHPKIRGPSGDVSKEQDKSKKKEKFVRNKSS